MNKLAAANMGRLVTTAALNNDLAQLKKLKSWGVSLDTGGSHPLHVAAFQGHQETVLYLLHEGVKVNQKDGGGLTPLDWAIDGNNREIETLLRKRGAKRSKDMK